MTDGTFFYTCIASYWSWNLLACSPGTMYGIMAFSFVGLNTNINWILTWNKKTKPTKLLFVPSYNGSLHKGTHGHRHGQKTSETKFR